jgi:hypothetical protein
MASLLKAFQRTASRFVAFFVPRPFTKASFRHVLETKKPVTVVTSFVNWLGKILIHKSAQFCAYLPDI